MTTLIKPTHVCELETLYACRDAIEYAATHPDAESAWAACTRGDWMLWICGKLSGPPESDGRQKLVACCCECARLSLPLYETQYPDDNRVRTCLDIAERWSRGEGTLDELLTARRTAYAAAYADADADAADADAAAYADAAADAAAYAAAAADADAAADAAAYAAAAAGQRCLAKCADIVRRHYPQPPKIADCGGVAGKFHKDAKRTRVIRRLA